MLGIDWLSEYSLQESIFPTTSLSSIWSEFCEAPPGNGGAFLLLTLGFYMLDKNVYLCIIESEPTLLPEAQTKNYEELHIDFCHDLRIHGHDQRPEYL